MSEFLIQYEQVNANTWAYLSSLLLFALFFKFNRFWSIRNLDLLLLVLLAPGLLLIRSGENRIADAWQMHQRLEEVKAAEAALLPLPPIGSGPAFNSPEETTLESGPESVPGPDTSTDTETVGDAETTPDVAPPSDIPSVPSAAAADPANPDSTAPPAPATPTGELGTDDVFADSTGALPDDKADDYPPKLIFREAQHTKWYGFFWLFLASSLILARLLLDPTMVRRPLLEPNLSLGGMAFLCAALYVFLMGNVLGGNPTTEDIASVRYADDMLNARKSSDEDEPAVSMQGPGLSVLNAIPVITTRPWVSEQGTSQEQSQRTYAAAAKVIAVLGQLAIVLGIIAIGVYHFHNLKMGVGAATIYLMLPYTAMYTGRTSHVLLGVLLVWAVVCYRRPLIAGILMGLALGAFYYPLFLMPLWISFYFRRGWSRFGLGVLASVSLILFTLIFTSETWQDYWNQVRQMFGLWEPKLGGLQGIWQLNWNPVYRLPVLAAFFSLSVSLAIWPARKHLGTLLSCSAALMVAVQFWHGFGGGLLIAWYLPLLLLTVFRPNLEDRVAIAVLEKPHRRNGPDLSIDRAA